MNDDLAGRKKRARAMLTVLQEEYLKSTGEIADSKEDLEAWLAKLPPAERNRIGGRINEANALG